MENLKKARIKKQLTQEKLGELVGVQKSVVSKYERGAVQPSNDVLCRMSDVLGVSVDYLLGKTDIKNPPEQQTPEDIAKVALFGGAGEVTEEMWQEVKSFVEFVKQKHGQDRKNG